MWKADAQDTDGRPDDVRTSDIGGEHFDNDLGAFTIAFLPEGESIPPPPSAATILEEAVKDGPINTEADPDATSDELQDQFPEGADTGEVPTEARRPAP